MGDAGVERGGVVRGDDDVKRRECGQLRCGGAAVEQDGQRDAGRADRTHVSGVATRQRVDAFRGDQPGDRGGVEAVGVALGHRVHAGAAGKPADQAEVVADGIDIDLHPRGALRRRV